MDPGGTTELISPLAIPEKTCSWISVHVQRGSNHIDSIESPVRCYFRAIPTKMLLSTFVSMC
jgi:hypothetical protein